MRAWISDILNTPLKDFKVICFRNFIRTARRLPDAKQQEEIIHWVSLAL